MYDIVINNRVVKSSVKIIIILTLARQATYGIRELKSTKQKHKVIARQNFRLLNLYHKYLVS